MKLLVFAQTPPPVHGQSIMVRSLVDGLPAAARADGAEIEVIHVNPALSRDMADIGRARAGKVFALLRACWRALRARMKCGGEVTLYYVPAPGKRAAVWRDVMAMFLLRPFFSRLVLHWHAAGLGGWLVQGARAPERWLARIALGRAAAALVLAPELAGDAQAFSPRKVLVVANGLDVETGIKTEGGAPPALEMERAAAPPGATRPCSLLFLGMCGREKGLFALLDALAVLERETPGEFSLTVAGEFASAGEEREFNARLAADNASLRARARHAGVAGAAQKRALHAAADIFVLPTHYAHEAQPLALIEAMANDLPVVATRWRAIPGMLPECPHARLTSPRAPAEALAAAIRAARAAGPPRGVMRAHYEKHFTRAAHLASLARALREI